MACLVLVIGGAVVASIAYLRNRCIAVNALQCARKLLSAVDESRESKNLR
jgi:hypothetical protein